MYDNFGDIGMNIKKMVDDFQQVAKSNQNIQTIGLYLRACSLTLGCTASVSVATPTWYFSSKKKLLFIRLAFLQRTWLNLSTTTRNTEKCKAMFLSM